MTSGPTDGTNVTIAHGDLTADVADRLIAAELIAIDTETSGLNWSTESLQLCQLFSAETGAVLLRPTGATPRNLIRVLEHPGPAKVFHFAPFDLQFLQATWGVTARNIRCTKTAHKLLQPAAPSRQHSLSALTEQYLGVRLDKGAVRTSNWGGDQLTDAQIRYAIGDVVHLIPLLKQLEAALANDGLFELFDEICRYLPIGVQLEVRGYPNPFDY